LSEPQIINGGQTAYTLAKIYEEYEATGKAEQIFRDKEVLFKIIVIRPENKPEIEFIERISDATNKQTSVEEADRRSNLSIQVKIQKSIYNDYGFLYERKKGEFYNGIQNGYVDTRVIIDRNDFIRAYLAFKGNPRWARQKGKEELFRIDYFTRIIDSPSNYERMFFSWMLLTYLHIIERHRARGKWHELTEFAKDFDFGSSLRYGKMAVVAAAGTASNLKEEELAEDIIISTAQKTLSSVFEKWKAFEDWLRIKRENKDFSLQTGFDFNFYYKGRTVDSDVAEFFKPAL
jgi:DNA-dependent RNA polymerase auxiliary subunit epsilon